MAKFTAAALAAMLAAFVPFGKADGLCQGDSIAIV